MAGGGSRGIHAARPKERDLRSACTQVAIGGVWDFCVRGSTADQRQINGRSTANQEQNQIKSFPAEASPKMLAVFAWTGFSREWTRIVRGHMPGLRALVSLDECKPL